MNDSVPLLDWLRNRYTQQCDGDWEHERGVEISTLFRTWASTTAP
ncbi:MULTISPECIES: Imm53 family immunity protein [unclassified Streptomyces]|nr:MULTISPECIES: Imm53 family immunity protein [unclassified Streptomyces]WUB87704.1 immunity 53 family protein [Streptomyces sp. NBC_00566]